MQSTQQLDDVPQVHSIDTGSKQTVNDQNFTAATTLATRVLGGATASNRLRVARAERTVVWTELALTIASGLVLRDLPPRRAISQPE